jgi:hypothetical protein
MFIGAAFFSRFSIPGLLRALSPRFDFFRVAAGIRESAIVAEAAELTVDFSRTVFSGEGVRDGVEGRD